jgi:hypothetical protein
VDRQSLDGHLVQLQAFLEFVVFFLDFNPRVVLYERELVASLPTTGLTHIFTELVPILLPYICQQPIRPVWKNLQRHTCADTRPPD